MKTSAAAASSSSSSTSSRCKDPALMTAASAPVDFSRNEVIGEAAEAAVATDEEIDALFDDASDTCSVLLPDPWGTFDFPKLRPDPAPAFLDHDRTQKFNLLSINQKTATAIVKIATKRVLCVDPTMSAAEKTEIESVLNQLAKAAAADLPMVNGKPSKFTSWQSVYDNRSTKKTAMAKLILEYADAQPEVAKIPDAELEAAVRALHLRTGHASLERWDGVSASSNDGKKRKNTAASAARAAKTLRQEQTRDGPTIRMDRFIQASANKMPKSSTRTPLLDAVNEMTDWVDGADGEPITGPGHTNGHARMAFAKCLLEAMPEEHVADLIDWYMDMDKERKFTLEES